MQLTQKIKIKPTLAQQLVLNALSERCRLIYNFALKERQDAFVKGEKCVGYLKQQNDLPELKNKYSEYKWVHSKVLQYVLRTLDSDYKSFFALRKKGDAEAQPPDFKSKKNFTTMVFNQSGFKHGEGFIELSHKHPLATKLWFEVPKKFIFSKVYQITIFKKDNDFFLSVVYEKSENKFEDNVQYQAFDLGLIKHTAVNLDGKFIEFKVERPDKYWQKPKEALQSRMSHCKKYSSKWYKLNQLFWKVTQKSSNQLKDFQHKLSRKILNNTRANTIIVGELDTKKMSQKSKTKGMSRSLQNTGSISRFVGFLTYKGKLMGKRAIEICERDTTKMCCCCGAMHEMPLSKRQYICECGNNIDRDRNSAVNIMLRYLSTNGLWTAYWQFVSNLRHTGLTIVNHSQEALTSKC